MPFSSPAARAAFFEKLKKSGQGTNTKSPVAGLTPPSSKIPMYPSDAILSPAPTIKTIKPPRFGKVRKLIGY